MNHDHSLGATRGTASPTVLDRATARQLVLTVLLVIGAVTSGGLLSAVALTLP